MNNNLFKAFWFFGLAIWFVVARLLDHSPLADGITLFFVAAWLALSIFFFVKYTRKDKKKRIDSDTKKRDRFERSRNT